MLFFSFSMQAFFSFHTLPFSSFLVFHCSISKLISDNLHLKVLFNVGEWLLFSKVILLVESKTHLKFHCRSWYFHEYHVVFSHCLLCYVTGLFDSLFRPIISFEIRMGNVWFMGESKYRKSRLFFFDLNGMFFFVRLYR